MGLFSAKGKDEGKPKATSAEARRLTDEFLLVATCYWTFSYSISLIDCKLLSTEPIVLLTFTLCSQQSVREQYSFITVFSAMLTSSWEIQEAGTSHQLVHCIKCQNSGRGGGTGGGLLSPSLHWGFFPDQLALKPVIALVWQQ